MPETSKPHEARALKLELDAQISAGIWGPERGSQLRLMKKSGVTQATISKFRNTGYIGPASAEKLAQALGSSLDGLVQKHRTNALGTPAREFIEWILGYPAIVDCARQFADVLVSDLLMLKVDSTRRDKASAADLYKHVISLRENSTGGRPVSKQEAKKFRVREIS